MTLQDTMQKLVSRLSAIYEEEEAMNIADLVMEKLTGWNKIDRTIHKETSLPVKQQKQSEKYINELLEHRPVQYVLGEAWFAGMKLYVNESVLIPRPETEELVEWIAEGTKIADIGTGSGCIPLALKNKFPTAEVVACDISKAALEVAAANAKNNQADIQFIQCNILNKNEWDQFPQIDVIVSNPPYIPLKDRNTMRENVLNYEPALALFVPDDDPLLFYRTIADFAIAKKVNILYFEIHEEQGDNVVQLLKAKGFTAIELRKDMQGKNRMVRAGF